ncbi:MAG: glycosyltransferase family 39 protein [Candidatus Aenigmarchaeota archaeon]|nr:glycosyltransferase family 39 protein [Candidatus Aenigmarchaeota archaeon]
MTKKKSSKSRRKRVSRKKRENKSRRNAPQKFFLYNPNTYIVLGLLFLVFSPTIFLFKDSLLGMNINASSLSEQIASIAYYLLLIGIIGHVVVHLNLIKPRGKKRKVKGRKKPAMKIPAFMKTRKFIKIVILVVVLLIVIQSEGLSTKPVLLFGIGADCSPSNGKVEFGQTHGLVIGNEASYSGINCRPHTTDWSGLKRLVFSLKAEGAIGNPRFIISDGGGKSVIWNYIKTTNSWTVQNLDLGSPAVLDSGIDLSNINSIGFHVDRIDKPIDVYLGDMYAIDSNAKYTYIFIALLILLLLFRKDVLKFIRNGIKNLKKGRNYAAVLLLLIIILGFGLRFYDLGVDAFDEDEIVTNGRITDDIPTIWTKWYPNQVHYIIFHIAFYSGMQDPFSLRFISLIFGLLGIFVMYKLGKGLFGKNIGVIAALLLSISIAHIHYAQKMRYYSILTFLIVLSFYLFWRMKNEKEKGKWFFGYAVVMTFALFTHYSAIIVLIVHIAYLVFLTLYRERGVLLGNKKFRFNSGKWLKNLETKHIKRNILIVVGILLILSPIYGISQSGIGGEQIKSIGIAKTRSVEFTPYFFTDMFGWLGAGTGIALLVFILFFVLGLFRIYEHDKEKFILLVTWIFLPLILIFFIKIQLFSQRHLFLILFSYLIVIANGAILLTNIMIKLPKRKKISTKLENKQLLTAVLITAAVFISITAAPLGQWYEWKWYNSYNEMNDWEGVTEYLKDNLRPGDVVFAANSKTTSQLLYFLNGTFGGYGSYKDAKIIWNPDTYYKPMGMLGSNDSFGWLVTEPGDSIRIEKNKAFWDTIKLVEERTFKRRALPVNLYKLKLRENVIFHSDMESFTGNSNWVLDERIKNYHGVNIKNIYARSDAKINYEFNITEDGKYSVFVFAKTGDGRGKLSFGIDGGEFSKPVRPIKGMTNPIYVASQSLSKGKHTITFKNTEGEQNLYYFYISPTDAISSASKDINGEMVAEFTYPDTESLETIHELENIRRDASYNLLAPALVNTIGKIVYKLQFRI